MPKRQASARATAGMAGSAEHRPKKWGDRGDLNPQPPDPQSGALPLSYGHHDPGGMRRSRPTKRDAGIPPHKAMVRPGGFEWLGRRSRRPPWRSALGGLSHPDPLRQVQQTARSYGTPGRIRTSDPLLRRQPLCPTELRARVPLTTPSFQCAARPLQPGSPLLQPATSSTIRMAKPLRGRHGGLDSVEA